MHLLGLQHSAHAATTSSSVASISRDGHGNVHNNSALQSQFRPLQLLTRRPSRQSLETIRGASIIALPSASAPLVQQLLPPQSRQSLETGTGTSIIALPFSLSSARTSVRISPNRLRPLHCERFRALGLEAPSPMPHSRSLGAASTSVRGCVARRVSSNLGFCQNCNNTGRGGGGREGQRRTPSTGLRHPSFNHCRI